MHHSGDDAFQVPASWYVARTDDRLCDVEPGGVFSFRKRVGTLREGATADIAIFELAEDRFELTDSGGAARIVARKLIPATTVKGGVVYTP